MINRRKNTYQAIVALIAVLIIMALGTFFLMQAINGDSASRAAGGSLSESRDAARLDAPVDASADAGKNTTGSRGTNAYNYTAIDTEAFFSDRMQKSGEAATDKIIAGDGLSLLAAAGLGAGADRIMQVAVSAAPNANDISLIDRLAATTALLPDSPLSSMGAAVIFYAPLGSALPASLASSAGGALIRAYDLIEADSALLDAMATYADAIRRPIYLTIDDGPSSLTQQYLDIFKAKNIRATFFVVGSNVRKFPDVIKTMYDDGHCIANHSYTHNYSRLYQSSQSLRSEIERCDKAISDVLGFEYSSGVFRFPGGSGYRLAGKYKSEIKKLGFEYYDWNCLNGDAQIKDRSPDSLYKYMLSTFKEQDEVILLMHDTATKQSTVDMLERAIDFFLEKGYEFHTLDEK